MKKNVAFILRQSIAVLLSRTSQGTFWKKIRFSAAGLALLFTLSAGVTPLYAQYHEDPVNQDLKNKEGDLSSGNKGDIENFARGFYLARWTAAENMAELHKFRQETAEKVAGIPTANKAVCQETLVSLFAEMAQRDDLYPQTRYNAALAIGMFNEREPGSNGEGGIPYAPAIAKMVEIFNAGEENPKGGKAPDYVILAILINLERYASLGIQAPEDKKAVINTFTKVLDPAFGKKHNYSSDVTVWMQKLAVEGLTLFASPSAGDNDTFVLDTFIRLIQDKSTDSSVQSAALRGIGSMKIEEGNNVNLASVVSAVARGALLLNQKDITFIDEENIRTQVDSTQGAQRQNALPNMGGNQGGGASDGTETVVARVKYDLESLRTAISNNGQGGILALLTTETDEPLKAALESLLDQIETVNNYLDFGEESRTDGFDPKKAKRPKQSKNAGIVFMVNAQMVRSFLTEQTDNYQDILESLINTEEGK